MVIILNKTIVCFFYKSMIVVLTIAIWRKTVMEISSFIKFLVKVSIQNDETAHFDLIEKEKYLEYGTGIMNWW